MTDMICPKCYKYYPALPGSPDLAGKMTCPLKHCPQCGAEVYNVDRPHWEGYNIFFALTFGPMIIIVFLGMFLTGFYIKSIDLTGSVLIVIFIISIVLTTYWYLSHYECPKCEKKFLRPTTNVPLVEMNDSKKRKGKSVKDRTIVYDISTNSVNQS